MSKCQIDCEKLFHYLGGNVDCIKLLISKCQNDKQRKQLFAEDNESRVPTFTAVIEGQVAAVDFFLKQMDGNQKTKFYQTRVDDSGPVKYLVSQGDETTKDQLETLKVLISHLNEDDDHLYTTWLFGMSVFSISEDVFLIFQQYFFSCKNG